MKRFKLRVAREEETPIDPETVQEEEQETVDDTTSEDGGEDAATADNSKETPPEEPSVSSDNVSERIRARQQERARAKAANDQSTEYAQSKTQEEEVRTNPEDTSNVDAAIAAAAAKVNPSPETVEDAAEKRRYAELVNNRAEAETNSTGDESGSADSTMDAGEQEARTQEAEAEVESTDRRMDRFSGDEETTTAESDAEISEITQEVEASTSDVEDVAGSTNAVEAFLDMARDSLHGNGISPLAASIGSRMINQLSKKAGFGQLNTTGIGQESFADNQRAATEGIIQKGGDIVVRIYRRIIQWFKDLWTWLEKFYYSFRQGADKTLGELQDLEEHWRVKKDSFRGVTGVINLAVVSQLAYTVTSKNNRASDVVTATATTLDGIFKDLNAASGNSLAKWAKDVKGNAANSFTFSSISSLLPRCMQANKQSQAEWDVFTSPELAGSMYLVATVPTRSGITELTQDDITNTSMNLEPSNNTDVQQLAVSRDSQTVDKLFSACYRIRESVKLAKTALKRQELDMASLNKSIEHLGKEIENYQETDDEKAEKRKALANLSSQIMLSQKLFNSPVMKLATYALKVQRATITLTKKVIDHKEAIV